MLGYLAPQLARRTTRPVFRRLASLPAIPRCQLWHCGLFNCRPTLNSSKPRVNSLYTVRPKSISTRDDQNQPISKQSTGLVERPKPTVDVVSQHGQQIKHEIKASYADKPKAVNNLLKRLSELRLLKDPSGAPYNSHGWELAASGSVLHRYTSFGSRDDLKQARREIDKAASELNHDPHIYEDVAEDTDIPYMLISCTTHHPAGLSVKDAKLAKRVDEILERIGEREDKTNINLSGAEMLAMRRKAYKHNMANIDHECKCARSH